MKKKKSNNANAQNHGVGSQKFQNKKQKWNKLQNQKNWKAKLKEKPQILIFKKQNFKYQMTNIKTKNAKGLMAADIRYWELAYEHEISMLKHANRCNTRLCRLSKSIAWVFWVFCLFASSATLSTQRMWTNGASQMRLFQISPAKCLPSESWWISVSSDSVPTEKRDSPDVPLCSWEP